MIMMIIMMGVMIMTIMIMIMMTTMFFFKLHSFIKYLKCYKYKSH